MAIVNVVGRKTKKQISVSFIQSILCVIISSLVIVRIFVSIEKCLFIESLDIL